MLEATSGGRGDSSAVCAALDRGTTRVTIRSSSLSSALFECGSRHYTPLGLGSLSLSGEVSAESRRKRRKRRFLLRCRIDPRHLQVKQEENLHGLRWVRSERPCRPGDRRDKRAGARDCAGSCARGGNG